MKTPLNTHNIISLKPLHFLRASLRQLAFPLIIPDYIFKLAHSLASIKPLYKHLPYSGNKFIFFIGKNEFDKISHPKFYYRLFWDGNK